MPSLAVGLWIVNVALETGGQLSFKSAANARHNGATITKSPFLWIGIGCFALEFVAWFALIGMIPLSEAMLINSINIVAVMVAGRFLFRERLDVLRVAGAALVALGVALAGTA